MTLETSGPRSHFQNLLAVRTALPLYTDPRQVILVSVPDLSPAACITSFGHVPFYGLTLQKTTVQGGRGVAQHRPSDSTPHFTTGCISPFYLERSHGKCSGVS